MSRRDPLVTVVIPSYNCGRFLQETLESAFAQTYRHIEVLVIDDGSTDDSPAVLDRYAGRVRVLRQPNQGVSAARNLGIRESSGELVAFLDADDLWHPEKLAKQVARFTDESVGLVHCAVEYIDESGTPLGTNLTGRTGRVLKSIALLDGTVVLAGGSTAVVRKTCFDRAGYFDRELSTAADWDMWRRIACYYAIDMVREPLMKYRLRQASMHRNVSVFEHDMLYGFARMFADPAASEVHDLQRRAYGALYLMLCGSFFYAGRWGKTLHYAAKSVAAWPPSLAYIAALPARAFKRRMLGLSHAEPAIHG
jgi:glycosyltransferase involved in cell wall biosynthesis